MCVAIMQKAGKQVEKEYLAQYASTNRDGCGILYIDGNKLKQYKTMVFEEFYKAYVDICKKYGNKPMLVHFRLGTSGKKDLSNCHPFMVNDSLGFIHNGVIYNEVIGTSVELSDTNLFNRKILRPLNNDIMNIKETQFLISEFIGSGNKLVFLSSNEQFLIINEDAGMWHDDIWYSNKWARNLHSTMFSSPSLDRNRGCAVYNTPKKCIVCETELMYSSNFVTVYDKGYRPKYVCNSCAADNTLTLQEILRG
jgi:glutamine amidotransferase